MGGERLELALENFNQAINLDKNDAMLFNGRGALYQKL